MNTIRWSLASGILALATVTTVGCERKTERSRENPTVTGADAPRNTEPAQSEARPVDPARTTANERAAHRGEPMINRNDPSAAVVARGNDAAVRSITAARCDRETRCSNVGPGKRYETREECVTKVSADWRSDLNALECPNGVAEQGLNECVEHLRDEKCANPINTLARVVSCRTVDICKST